MCCAERMDQLKGELVALRKLHASDAEGQRELAAQLSEARDQLVVARAESAAAMASAKIPDGFGSGKGGSSRG